MSLGQCQIRVSDLLQRSSWYDQQMAALLCVCLCMCERALEVNHCPQIKIWFIGGRIQVEADGHPDLMSSIYWSPCCSLVKFLADSFILCPLDILFSPIFSYFPIIFPFFSCSFYSWSSDCYQNSELSVVGGCACVFIFKQLNHVCFFLLDMCCM